MKTVLVVCNHGNTSQDVGANLRRELPDYLFLARGAIDRVPSDEEIKDAIAVVIPFSNERIEKLKSMRIENSFWAKWLEFLKRIEGKPIFKYFDSGKDDFVDFHVLAEQIGAVAV
ncbi:MAG: hypothetical protein V1835_07260 [Candidatus Micrarchaeota archaeon]